MSSAESKEKLVSLITDLNEEETLQLVRDLIDIGEDPLNIIDLCHKGMIEVGILYEQGSYFISGLIMAGDIMRQINQIVFPYLDKDKESKKAGNIVLGTVEGDIHYLGKDIFKALVSVFGFAVHDIGVDASSDKFLAAVQEFRPRIVGLSCLVTSAITPMQETISRLKDTVGDDLPLTYIIGGQVDELVCKQVGADYWATNAMEGVRMCQKITDQKVNG